MPSVAIVGASSQRDKFGNISLRAHLARGWTVYPINPRGGEIEGLPVYRSLSEVPGPIDRIALYLPPELGLKILGEIVAIGAPETYVNPGAGSPALFEEARALGVPVRDACAIVAIGESPSRYL